MLNWCVGLLTQSLSANIFRSMTITMARGRSLSSFGMWAQLLDLQTFAPYSLMKFKVQFTWINRLMVPGVIFVFDLSNRVSFKNIQDWKREFNLVSQKSRPGLDIPSVIVGTKMVRIAFEMSYLRIFKMIFGRVLMSVLYVLSPNACNVRIASIALAFQVGQTWSESSTSFSRK